MIAVAIGVLLYTDSGLYDVINYRLGRQLPLGPAVLLLYHATEPMLGLLPLVILVFPDGRLPSPRWRWVLCGYLAVGLADMAVLTVAAAYAITRHRIQVDASRQLTLTSRVLAYEAAGALAAVVFAGLWLLSVGYQMVSWRRSARRAASAAEVADGRRSHRLCLVGRRGGARSRSRYLASARRRPPGRHRSPTRWHGHRDLEYRLYDIDRIISRTLAYAIVTGLLIGLYAGLVLLATQVRGSIPGSGRRSHACSSGVVQPAAAAGSADGGPAVQPGPLRRRPDGCRLRGRAQGRGRLDTVRTTCRPRVPGRGTRAHIGVDQPT